MCGAWFFVHRVSWNSDIFTSLRSQISGQVKKRGTDHEGGPQEAAVNETKLARNLERVKIKYSVVIRALLSEWRNYWWRRLHSCMLKGEGMVKEGNQEPVVAFDE